MSETSGLNLTSVWMVDWWRRPSRIHPAVYKMLTDMTHEVLSVNNQVGAAESVTLYLITDGVVQSTERLPTRSGTTFSVINRV